LLPQAEALPAWYNDVAYKRLTIEVLIPK